MRKVIMFNRVSLDGYFAGLNGEIDWFLPDSDVDRDIHQAARVDTTILGRVTYQMFESYWPHVLDNPSAGPAERKTAEELNQMTKVVFSKTMQSVNWENSQLFTSDLTGEVARLKQAKGDDIIIFGSGQIVQQLTNAGLIDDYYLVITPIIVGSGKSLFTDADKIKFQLVTVKQYKSGNVMLHYKI